MRQISNTKQTDSLGLAALRWTDGGRVMERDDFSVLEDLSDTLAALICRKATGELIIGVKNWISDNVHQKFIVKNFKHLMSELITNFKA